MSKENYADSRATEAMEAASSPANLTRTDAAQTAYDEAYAEAAQDYDRAAQLWRVTIGDWDMRFERVAAVFGKQLADAVGSAENAG